MTVLTPQAEKMELLEDFDTYQTFLFRTALNKITEEPTVLLLSEMAEESDEAFINSIFDDNGPGHEPQESLPNYNVVFQINENQIVNNNLEGLQVATTARPANIVLTMAENGLAVPTGGPVRNSTEEEEEVEIFPLLSDMPPEKAPIKLPKMTVSCATCRKKGAGESCTAKNCFACFEPFPETDGYISGKEMTAALKTRVKFESEYVVDARTEKRQKILQDMRRRRPACQPCGHAMCKCCMLRRLEVFIQCVRTNDWFRAPQCCGRLISLKFIKRFAKPALIREYVRARNKFEVRMSTLLYCTQPTCSTLIPPSNFHTLHEIVFTGDDMTRTSSSTELSMVFSEQTAPSSSGSAGNASENGDIEEDKAQSELVVPNVANEKSIESQTEELDIVAESDPRTTIIDEAQVDELPQVINDSIADAAPLLPDAIEPASSETREFPKRKRKAKHAYKRSRLAICPKMSCLQPVCTLCKFPFHGFEPCSLSISMSEFLALESIEGDEENYDENGDYAEENFPLRTVQCLKCGNLISRNTGCNHITCQCNAQFCFECGVEWSDSNAHYDCPLSWDEDITDHKVIARLIVNKNGEDAYGMQARSTTLPGMKPLCDIKEDEEKATRLLDCTRVNESADRVWRVKDEYRPREFKVYPVDYSGWYEAIEGELPFSFQEHCHDKEEQWWVDAVSNELPFGYENL